MSSRPAPDPLAMLDAIPLELVPLAMMRLMMRTVGQGATVPAATQEPATMLSPKEAAMRLGVTRRWVWDHADRLGAVKLSPTMMRIPAANVERELQTRGTRKAG